MIAVLMFAIALIAVQTSAQTPQLSEASTATPETYQAVDITADGNLRIRTSARTVIVRKGGLSKAGETFGRQTAFQNPVLSADRRAVGAQALFENCCTSYDIPLQLVIYANGKTHRFEGGLAIFQWHFVDGGPRVAFSQETVHSACGVHWELREIASERLLAQVDIPQECGPAPMLPKVTIPTWVTGTVSRFR